MIKAYSVAYIDVTAIRSVANPSNPTGPLGGLGPLPDTHKLDNSSKVDLYQFQFGLRDKDVVDLLDGLSGEKRVAVLEAGTGTGKSTFGPFRLMKPPDRSARADGSPPYSPTDHGPIVVTEPRIPATTGVATFVGEALCFGHEDCTDHIGPGFPVGYQKQGEKHWDDACRLIYVTDGTMINWIREGRLARIGMVIVDEAHERSENIDLILALLRDQLPRYPHLRVVIASATIDKTFFIEYFGGGKKVHHQFVEAVKGVGYGVPFFPALEITEDIIYNGFMIRNEDEEPVAKFYPWPEHLHAHTRTLIDLASTEEIPVEEWKPRMPKAVAQQALRLLEGTPPDSGDILAFLPTAETIEEACRLIERAVRGQKVKVYRLLSSIKDERLKREALEPSKPGRRKVVVSSNLAETSLTVSGVRYVIDSGLICQSEWDPKLARESLPSIPHSQSGVRQRWGRVGRDQPGWVFPLYTRAQFINEMPHDTPPGSTRANLEQFLVKLKAAGVDRPQDVQFPGDFVGGTYKPDKHGEDAAALFSMEIERAERALAANGAVDKDGHLTALGREMERFSGSPEHAMAIMFADRLACVPEVGMALSLLSNGRLVDRTGLLRFDTAWPPAWRIQAALCHRALAVGCQDDLDLVLHICAAWERASDPEAWARRWWVSHELLESAKDETKEFLGTLSPAMKEEADRPIEPSLIPRARAVMSRALASVTYEPATVPDAWQLELDRTAPTVELGDRQLIRPGGRVLALSRFQLTDRPGSRLRAKSLIQGLVSVTPWARKTSPDEPEPDPFDLLIRAATELDGDTAAAADSLDLLRATFPVGSVVAVGEATSQTSTRRLVLLHDAPDPEVVDLENLDDETGEEEDAEVATARAARRRGRRSAFEEAASFDVSRPSLPGSEQPDEERAASLQDVRALEANDPESPTRANGPSLQEPERSQDGLAHETAHVPVVWEGAGTQGRETIAWVAGYTIEEGLPAVVLRPQEVDGPRSLSPPDLQIGDEITVTVRGGSIKDHLDEFRVLEADGGKGEFLHRVRALDPFKPGWIQELEEDSTWPGVAVPGFGSKDPLGVTLLPGLHEQFAQLHATGGRRAGDRWYRATIVEVTERPILEPEDGPTEDQNEASKPENTPGSQAQATIELRVPTGLSPALFRFVVPPSKLGDLDGLREGIQVEVRIGSPRASLPVPPDGGELLERLDGELEVGRKRDEWVTAGMGPMSARARSILFEGPKSLKWERAVWRCWLESHRLHIYGVRLAGSHQQIEMSPDSAIAIRRSGKRKEIGEKHNVSIDIDEETGIGSAEGDPAAVEAALQELANVAAWPSVVVDLPGDLARRLLWKEGDGSARKHIDRVREIPGILACRLDFDTATLALTGSDEAVAEAVELVRRIVSDYSIRVRERPGVPSLPPRQEAPTARPIAETPVRMTGVVSAMKPSGKEQVATPAALSRKPHLRRSRRSRRWLVAAAFAIVIIVGVGLVLRPLGTPRIPESLLEPPAKTATGLASQLADVEEAIHDGSQPQQIQQAAGELHQMIYRNLAEHRSLRRQTLALLGKPNRAIAQSITSAQAKLLSLTRSHKSFPRWAVGPPEPPDRLLSYYQNAERRTDVGWEYLAAIHLFATRMGRIVDQSPTGPRGPMQLRPATWKKYGKGDIDSNRDSILATARLLKAKGAPRRIGRALRVYYDSEARAKAITLLARVMEKYPREYYAFYYWQVLYERAKRLYVVPEGYPEVRPFLAISG